MGGSVPVPLLSGLLAHAEGCADVGPTDAALPQELTANA